MENIQKNILVSVIVPVYNTEKYLEKCVNSILAQTYRNLEIILVDDGSKDLSGSICDEFAEKDCRVKVIHKENGGLSSARNSALDICKGDYILFIDSDDWVKEKMVADMIEQIQCHDADMVVCGVGTETRGKVLENIYGIESYIPKTNRELMCDYVTTGFVKSVVWNKIYHKDFFANIRFPQGLIHEDVYVVHQIIGQSQRAVYLPTCHYIQYERIGSITQSQVSERDFSLLEADEKLHEYYEARYPDLAKYTVAKKANDCAVLMQRIYRDFSYRKNKSMFMKLKQMLIEEYKKCGDVVNGTTKMAIEKPMQFAWKSRLEGIRRKIGLVVKKVMEKNR